MRKKVIRVLKAAGIVILCMIAIVIGFFAYVLITEFKPEDVEELGYTTSSLELDKRDITLVTWNTGYAGLDASTDFVLDGGKQVNPASRQLVAENMEAIDSVLEELRADFYLLQEVDYNSSRSFHLDAVDYYLPALATRIYARNLVCRWIPYPIPMIGKVDSGVVLLSDYRVSDAIRRQLPIPFSWPVSVFNLKRCLEVSHVPISGCDEELTIINLHLEAYDDGEGKAAQKAMLMKVMEEEYAKGNYVIVGGDFNHWFPGTSAIYGDNPELWTPAYFEENDIPDGWRFAYDGSVPTCRSLDKPYTGSNDHQFYVLDGFILSPNVELVSVETLDHDFANTDHNPVKLRVLLGTDSDD
ncbi:MAG: endonuclease/exonuclease/phosphatase family protein [Lachnospiraceae bacterium]|nr:endonuclease/exonuclease/phosphatase family protein [Lachnospiraceae bacterium]